MNALIAIWEVINKRNLLTMKFDTIDACQNAWYQVYEIKISISYYYKNMFKNSDLKAINSNSGLQKSRSITFAIVSSINKIAKKELDKAPHLTCAICQDWIREPIKLFPSNMTHGFL